MISHFLRLQTKVHEILVGNRQQLLTSFSDCLLMPNKIFIIRLYKRIASSRTGRRSPFARIRSLNNASCRPSCQSTSLASKYIPRNGIIRINSATINSATVKFSMNRDQMAPHLDLVNTRVCQARGPDCLRSTWQVTVYQLSFLAKCPPSAAKIFLEPRGLFINNNVKCNYYTFAMVLTQCNMQNTNNNNVHNIKPRYVYIQGYMERKLNEIKECME